MRLCAAALLISCIAFAACNAVKAETLTGASLVQHLRQGGYVLLMRHAHSPVALPDKNSADAGNIHLERQLDDTGRDSARVMGAAIRKLGIPLGTVFSSPTYRALETVRLAALGTPQTDARLGDGGQSMVASAVSGQAGWLRQRVSERPKAGSNNFIITHMPNIQAAFGQDAADLTDGEALVFHPNGHNGEDLVAKIKIEDWPSLARH
jgi:phosphohistidine phosphatase SixA